MTGSRTGGAAWRSRFSQPLIVGVAGLPLAVVLLLLLVIVWLGLVADVHSPLSGPFTLRYYADIFTDPLVTRAMINTAGFCLVAVLTAMTIGVAIAWLVERTDLPGKKTVYSLMTLGLLLPAFFQAMGWLFFLHPRIGMLNTWLMRIFDLDTNPLSIANVFGMGWVEGLALTPLGFIMTAPVLRAMNPALEEAARVHGVGRWATFTRILLPLIWPGILAAAIYIAVIGTATFEVPAIIGLGNKILTFSTLVYIDVSPEMGQSNYGVVGALSMPMIVLSVLLSWWYFRIIRHADRYAVVQGKSYRPRLARLDRWRWAGWLVIAIYLILAMLLPLVMMIWAAFLPYFQPFSVAALSQLTVDNFRHIPVDLVIRGAVNSVILMLAVPIVALLFGGAISWVVVRSRLRGRAFFDWIAFLPHAVPGVIFAIAALAIVLFMLPGSVPLYGTLSLLLIVYILVRLSFTTRVLNGALLQIHRELEEAAYVSGISVLTTIRRIIFPLLLPAIVNLCLWNALLTFRELTMAAFLVSQNNITLPVVVWGVWQSGGLGQAAALSLIFVAAFIPIVALYWIFSFRITGEAMRM